MERWLVWRDEWLGEVFGMERWLVWRGGWYGGVVGV